MKRFAIAFAGLVATLVAAGPAFAGDTARFGALPTGGRAHFEVGYGTNTSDTILLRNHTAHPLTLKLYAADATLGKDGVIGIAFDGSPRTGLAAHVAVPRTVRIDANKEVSVSFNIDASSAGGPEMAAIVVEAAPVKSQGALSLVERIAILVRTALHPIGNGGGTAAVKHPGPMTAFGWWPAPGAVIALGLFILFKRRRRDERDEPEEAQSEPRPIHAEWSSAQSEGAESHHGVRPVAVPKRHQPVVVQTRRQRAS